MSEGIQSIIYPVKDLAAAKAVYGALLGVEPYVDQPYYVGYRVGGLEVGLDPHGQSHGPIAYRDVPDIAKALTQLLGAGATPNADPRDVGGGMQVATVTDADGNVLGLRQKP